MGGGIIKAQKTIKALQKILDDISEDDELMGLFGEALKFSIKCVKYTERNRWHDYEKEKPREGERIIWEALYKLERTDEIKEDRFDFSEGITEYSKYRFYRNFYGDEEYIFWKPYYNEKLEPEDINAI